MSWVCSSAQVAPTVQASNINWSPSSSNSITLNWTNGNGANRILVGAIGQSVDFTPTDNTIYSANSNFGNGQYLGPNMYVLYDGNGSSVTINSLNPNFQYTFRIYEYNGNSGSEKYLSATSGTAGGQAGYCGVPGGFGGNSYGCTWAGNPFTVAYNSQAQATNLQFKSVTSTSANVIYFADGASSSILVASTSPLNSTPSGNASYCASNTYGAGSAIGNGFVVAAFTNSCSGWSCNAISSGPLEWPINGLNPNTTYYFRAFEQSGDCTSNWITATGAGNDNTQFIKTTPDVPSSNIIFSNTTDTQTTLNWAPGNGAKRIVVASLMSTPNGPTNGYVYGGNSTFGSGYDIGGPSYVVYDGIAPTVTVTGLMGGFTYNFAVYEYNNPGTYFSVYGAAASASVNTAPSTPGFVPATNVTDVSFNANWSQTGPADAFFLDVSTDNTFSTFVTGYNNLNVGNVTTYSVNSNLSATYYYFYRVRAFRSGYGTSPNSNTVTVFTAPSPPTGTVATNVTDVSFTANWNSSLGATGYFLDVSTVSNFSSFVTGYNNLSVGNVTTFQVNSTLNGNTLYYFRVRATNGNGTSSNSNNGSLTTAAAAPTLSAFTNVTNNSFSANWGTSASATGYFLDVSTASNFSTFVTGYNNLSIGNVTTYSVNSNLNANTLYYVRLRASNSNGTSNSSISSSLTTAPPPPTISTASNVTNNSFSANWSSSASATGYFLDVSLVNNFSSFVTGYNNLSVGNVTTYAVNSNLAANTLYYIRVRATNANGTSNSSGSGTVTTAPAAPTLSTFTNVTNSSFSANWSASTAATGYFLDVSTASDFSALVSGYSNLSVGNVTTYSVNANLNANTLYYVRVRASNSNGISNSSISSSLTTAPAPPIVSATTNITDVSFSANWSASIAATGYFLDVSTTSNFSSFVTGYNNLSVGNVTTYPVNLNLSANTLYYFRVRANNSNGTSISSGVGSLTTAPPAPTALASSSLTDVSFTANWSTSAGAIGYFLDVSTTSNFSSFVSGYNNLAVGNVTTYAVSSSLSGNTTYYVRVRAGNSSSVPSVNSNTVSLTTLSPAPVGLAATQPSQTSFVANWNSIAGISNFKLDVSSNDFSSMLAGYNDLDVTGVSKAVTGLSAGQVYKYRLRAVNTSGSSSNSNIISVITVPPNVTGLQATSPAQDGFTLNWNPSSGADSYLLFLSEQSDFSALVTGYNPKNTSATSESFSGLKSGTTYYARLQSSNTSGVSGFSSVTSQITIPATPTLLPTDISLVSSSSFVAKWNSVTGADSYELTVVDVGLNIVANGFPATILAPDVLAFAQNLTPGRLYKYTLRTKNAAGFSPSSTYQLVQIHDASGGTNAPTVSVDATKTSISSIQVNISGSVLPLQLVFKHRKITDDKFVAEATSVITVSSSSASLNIDPSWSDELGVEYYFVLRDAANQVDSAKTSSYLYKSFTSQNIVGFESGFTGSANGYRMFSIPASFASKRVDEIFQSVYSQFGGYDKKKWRMFHYNTSKGDYDELQSGFTTIEEGMGYWFNATETPSLSITASVIPANQSQPAGYTLVKGWNQIGNPYPFNVDWTAVQAASTGAGLNSLWVYEAGNYVKKTVLASWKGAFVFSDNGGSIVFPVKSRTTAGGRIAPSEMHESLDEKQWLVPMKLELNDISQTSSIGMHPEASLSKDKYDEMAVPRFIEYLDMSTFHKEFFSHYFSSDIVPPQNKYEWTFDLSSSQTGSAVLSWNQEVLKENESSLLLIDLADQKWIDMKAFSSYRFSWKEGRQMKVVYARDGVISPGVNLVAQSYPNPFTTKVAIPILLEEGNLNAQINIYDMVGRKIKTISAVFDSPGAHEIEWDGKDDSGNETAAGVLIYKVMNISPLPARRMIKQ